MTRREFLEDIYSFDDLINICHTYGCSICDDVYTDRAKDDYINEQLVDMVRNTNSWQQLYNRLDDIPTNADYYHLDDARGYFYAIDEDFNVYKDAVAEWMDENEYWDDEEDPEEEEYFPPETEYADEELGEELCEDDLQPVDVLFNLCSEQFRAIDAKKKYEEQQSNEEFLAFTAGFCAVVND